VPSYIVSIVIYLLSRTVASIIFLSAFALRKDIYIPEEQSDELYPRSWTIIFCSL